MRGATNPILACVMTLTVFGSLAQKKICFTIDDLPVVGYGVSPEEERAITEGLLTTFDSFDIPAVGFVNESKLYGNVGLKEDRKYLIIRWLEEGVELGNHTYAHLNYHKSDLNTFAQDILNGAKVTKPLSAEFGLPYRYFRHPYLRVGLTKDHHDSLAAFLAGQGYIEAPVTIDNTDYLFAKAYAVAQRSGDADLAGKIGRDYVAYMEQMIVYFETLSEALFGRQIPQIQLLHANMLNADYMDDLARMMRERGYEFVSLSDCLKDPAYEEEITKYGDWGISWLERWALSRGGYAEFMKKSPPTPEYIVEMN